VLLSVSTKYFILSSADGGFSIMSVNSRKPCESECYEPSQYIELDANKVPAAQNSTKPTSGSIGDNEFSTNRIINQVLKILVILISIA